MGDEIALAEEAKSLVDGLDGSLPDARLLGELASEGHANLASVVLYEALLGCARHGPFIRTVDSAPVRAVPVRSAPLIVIVPGMFYRELPDIDADATLLTKIAARFGIETTVAPTVSLGSVSENVEVLNNFLRGLEDQPFWLVSMSRGSTEVKRLLQIDPDAPYLSRLHGWVSVCGILGGSPLHERIHSNRLFEFLHRGFARIYGVNPELSEELLRTDNDQWRPARLPDRARFVNIIAVPLSWHITNTAVRRYRRICHLGPTDGVVLLGDYLDEPGLIYPVWGVDHFMRTPGLAALFYRLLYHLFANEEQTHV